MKFNSTLNLNCLFFLFLFLFYEVTFATGITVLFAKLNTFCKKKIHEIYNHPDSFKIFSSCYSPTSTVARLWLLKKASENALETKNASQRLHPRFFGLFLFASFIPKENIIFLHEKLFSNRDLQKIAIANGLNILTSFCLLSSITSYKKNQTTYTDKADKSDQDSYNLKIKEKLFTLKILLSLFISYSIKRFVLFRDTQLLLYFNLFNEYSQTNTKANIISTIITVFFYQIIILNKYIKNNKDALKALSQINSDEYYNYLKTANAKTELTHIEKPLFFGILTQECFLKSIQSLVT